jgi:cell division transport system permease protein
MLDSVTFFRVIKTGFVNFWRNIWLSAAATMVMTITLVIFSVLALLFGVTKYSVGAIQDRVDVSVYFKTGVPESLINQFRQEFQQNPKVREVTYISADQALQTFKAKHADDPLVLDSLAELAENPLPATVQIKAHMLEDYPEIAGQIQDGSFKDQISKVNFEDNRLLIERLSKALRFIVVGGLALVIIFSVIAILVIFNTITLTIYNRREEVEIMRLVGATNGYIRGPFVIEGLLYSLVATAITGGLLLGLIAKFKQQIVFYLGDGAVLVSDQLAFGSWYLQWYVILGALLLVALILSIVSSMLAIRRYLRV